MRFKNSIQIGIEVCRPFHFANQAIDCVFSNFAQRMINIKFLCLSLDKPWCDDSNKQCDLFTPQSEIQKKNNNTSNRQYDNEIVHVIVNRLVLSHDFNFKEIVTKCNL